MLYIYLHMGEGLLSPKPASSIPQPRTVVAALGQRASVEQGDYQEPLGVLAGPQQSNDFLVPYPVPEMTGLEGGSDKLTSSRTL